MRAAGPRVHTPMVGAPRVAPSRRTIGDGAGGIGVDPGPPSRGRTYRAVRRTPCAPSPAALPPNGATGRVCYGWPEGPVCARTQGGRRIATGTVERFNAQKGFGFIQPEGGGNDVFVPISAVQKAGLQTLNENQRVAYEVVTERGKQAAANLRLA